MARQKKDSLDYFPFDVNFFSDIKIKRLKAKYKSDGICILLYIYTYIYRNSYYTDFDDDLILDISDEFNIKENRVREILNYTVSSGLLIVLPKICASNSIETEMSAVLEISKTFTRKIINFLCSRSLLKSSKLATQDKVITSKSVQRRYQEAKRGAKRDVFVEADYWILEKSETLGFIKVHPNENKSQINSDKSEKNINKSTINTIKESKVKESKVNMSSDVNTALKSLTQEQYSDLVQMSSRQSVDKYIDKIIDWQRTNHKTVKNPFGLISKWIQEDIKKNSKTNSNKDTSYDLDEWEKYAMSLGTDSGDNND